MVKRKETFKLRILPRVRRAMRTYCAYKNIKMSHFIENLIVEELKGSTILKKKHDIKKYNL
jgi:hypothetical protein